MFRDALVLLVEDAQDSPKSMRAMLANAGICSEVFASVESTLLDRSLQRFSCGVVDLQSAGTRGLELPALLRARGLELPIIAISGQATVREAIQAFEGGIFRYFEKPIEPPALLSALSQGIANNAERQQFALARNERLANLTQREREVLDLLLQDKATKQIARELQISPSTVEKHRAKILAKFNVDSVVGLAKCCLPLPSSVVTPQPPSWPQARAG